MQTQKRSFRNYFLQPLLQIRLGLYAIVLSLLFSIVVAGIVYTNMANAVEVIIELTEVEEEVRDLLNSYIAGMIKWVVLAFAGYLGITVIVSVFFTHRLVGPTYAFRRHLKELQKGNYHARTKLRKRDAFNEVAEELNKLSGVLLKQKEAPPES